MKKVISIIILLMPVLVSAQDFSAMNPQKMQAMMQKAQQMQVCMQNIDQVKMHEFQQRAKQMSEDVQALCSAGSRAEAMNRAMAFSDEIASNTAMQQVKKCGEIMQGVVPDLLGMAEAYQDDGSSQHICD
ncbi:MAG: hypothetical protein GQ475_03250 [Methylococcaceae bacterium]|nr:hypothetical protein [Methylococcaceae bacterium]